jgi:O-antigen ligase
LTCGWLLIIFLLGGSARGDVATLPLLRPLAVVMLAIGLCAARATFYRRNRIVLSLLAGVFALPLLQLVPLPPDAWQGLPHRGLVAQIDAWSGIGTIWRPLSLTPAATWNAFWSLFVPASVLVLVLQLPHASRVLVLWCLALASACSAGLALAQLSDGPESPLYLYAVTNQGSAVGLFANRNHQALLLAMMIPLVFVLASLRGPARSTRRKEPPIFPALRKWGLPVIIAAALLALLLITGSRAGILLCAVALPAIAWIVAPTRPQPSRWGAIIPALLWLVLLGAAVLLDRDLSLDRLTTSDPALDARATILPVILPLLADVMVLGTGLGSFDRFYLVHEPDALLSSSYMNHAHNDWLELAMTGGLPALVLLAALIVLILRRAYPALRRPSRDPQELPDAQAAMMTRLALVLLVMLALHSVGDYPLRVPSISAVAAVAIAFVLAYRDDRRTPQTKINNQPDQRVE